MESKTESKFISFIKRRTSELIAVLLLIITLAVFCSWLFTKESVTVHGIAAATVSLILFELGLMLCIPRAVKFFSGWEEPSPVESLGERSSKRSRLHPLVSIFLVVLVSRIMVILAAYAIAMLSGYRGTLFSTLKSIWYKLDTDAVHYANIAENWYTTEFPSAWALVFLPFYPICIRAANLIFHDTFVSAFVLNLLFSSGAGVVLYELALCDMGKRASRFAVFCAFALPAAIFYTAPMSEPLFLLLTVSALLAIRKEKFILAGIFGGLAAFTRSVGIVLLVPFGAEAIAYWVRLYKAEKAKGSGLEKRRLAGAMAKAAVGALLLAAGTGAYLLINKLLWGDWFKFMQLQKENWSQSLGWFFNTASYQTELLFQKIADGNVKTAIGLWLPNLLYIFGTLAVFIATARYLRTSYVLYFAAYFAVAIGATWLLSAPRYLTALAVLPIAIAKLCEGRDDGVGLKRARGKAVLIGALMIVGQVIYLAFYVLRYKLY